MDYRHLKSSKHVEIKQFPYEQNLLKIKSIPCFPSLDTIDTR